MSINKEEVFSTLKNTIKIDSPPKAVKNWIYEVVVGNSWASKDELAWELAEKHEQYVIACIKQELIKFDPFGRPKLYVLNSSSGYLIQGAAFIEPTDDKATQDHKRKRKSIYKCFDAIKALNYTQFEKFCTCVIKTLGAEKAVTTKHSDDQGIDFYGLLPFENHIFSNDIEPTIQKQMKIWLVGQAKHYLSSQVSTPDIREFVGSVELARARAFGISEKKKSKKYADLTIRVCDPIFQLFFTTGDISEKGYLLLENSGVIGLDGLTLAAFLCDRSVGFSNNSFSNKNFLEWVNK